MKDLRDRFLIRPNEINLMEELTLKDVSHYYAVVKERQKTTARRFWIRRLPNLGILASTSMPSCCRLTETEYSTTTEAVHAGICFTQICSPEVLKLKLSTLLSIVISPRTVKRILTVLTVLDDVITSV